MKFFGFGNDTSRGKGPLQTVLEGREDEALIADQEARTQNYGDHVRSFLGATKGLAGGSSTSVFNSSHVSIDSTLLFRVSHLSCCALYYPSEYQYSQCPVLVSLLPETRRCNYGRTLKP
eukprot:217699-Pyramimonas_sp.AAC.1